MASTEDRNENPEIAQGAPPSVAEPRETSAFPCRQCGAKMAFDPAAQAVTCPYCGHANAIPRSEADIHELDFETCLRQAATAETSHVSVTVTCSGCGAETTLQPDVTADTCPFCGAALVAGHEEHHDIRPRSLLPFKVDREAAIAAFRAWSARLWFAPRALKTYARTEGRALTGVYVPYWTYDADTTSFYRGERGDDYWVTETYTTTVNGKLVHRSRQVRKTRWRDVSGLVFEAFDDVLVLGSKSLPRRQTDRLEPWDLGDLVPYDDSYLAGFRAERYQIGLAEGFGLARDVMDERIRASIRRDIGGDHQRIHGVRTQHDRVTFKHLLLPVWISAYRFRDKVYRFLVNARTGEVQGERPWSWAKIALAAVLVALTLAGLAYALYATQ